MQPQRIYLKDYQAPHFSIDSVALDFDLNEDFCLVRATSRMNSLKAGESLVLDGEELELISLKIDGADVAPENYAKTAETLTIQKVPSSFTLEVVTKLRPQLKTSLEGLYKSNGCFVTQCEAQSFRHITYFLDRPDVMTRYEVRIEADKTKYPVLLSNGDRIHVKDLGNGRHEALWRDPHKKPCYLFALVAGDLGVIRDSFTTRSGRKVNLEVYAAHGKQERCHHAMVSLQKSMKWDEEAFGREYDLNDYMIVAIDDFNAGAMENKGLNIFNSKLVLADPQSATDLDYFLIESVVAHEYFHNWTGNRVTLRDWFHLSLKEGLTVFRDQEFSGDMTDRGLQRIGDVDSLREGQFNEDAGPNAHPVRPDSCLSVDNFFTMTIYEKGAELIRMMQTLVGRRGFRKGMDLYFERHDGQAVTTDDFAAAIAEANQADFGQLKLWYSQAGTPRVKVEESWVADKGEYTLTLEQSCQPTPGQPEKKPFEIPIRLGLLDREGRELSLDCKEVFYNSDESPLVLLKEPRQSFVFKNLKSRPVASLLREFSAPVTLDWDRDLEELAFLMANDTDGFNRREAAQQAALKVLSGLVTSAKAGKALQVSEVYLQAWSNAVTAPADPGYLANLLSLPSDSILMQHLGFLDAKAFQEARETLVKTLAQLNRGELLGIYRRYHGVDADKTDNKTQGHRSLKNLALSVLAESAEADVMDLVVEQYRSARNMTDRMSALDALVSSDDPRREEALQDFHQKWRTESTVLTKWFAVQARSTRRDTFEVVQKLVQHPDFQITNPNSVYALLRVFGTNLTQFHDPENRAYEFMADQILAVDPKNPQVASRLASCFQVIAKLSKEQAFTCAEQVRRVLASPQLSKNTRELLERLV